MNNTRYKVKKYLDRLKRSKTSSERQKYFTHLKQHYIQTGGDMEMLNGINNIILSLNEKILGENGLVNRLRLIKERVNSLEAKETKLKSKIAEQEEKFRLLKENNSMPEGEKDIKLKKNIDEIIKLEKEKNELEIKIKTAEEESDKLKNQNETLTGELTEIRKKLKESEDKNESSDKVISQLVSSYNNLILTYIIKSDDESYLINNNDIKIDNLDSFYSLINDKFNKLDKTFKEKRQELTSALNIKTGDKLFYKTSTTGKNLPSDFYKYISEEDFNKYSDKGIKKNRKYTNEQIDLSKVNTETEKKITKLNKIMSIINMFELTSEKISYIKTFFEDLRKESKELENIKQKLVKLEENL